MSETILTPKQQLTAEGMCDECQCQVLGVEAALETRKAKAHLRKVKAMGVIQAAKDDRVVDVQLVCQYAPEKVNDTDLVSCYCTPTNCTC